MTVEYARRAVADLLSITEFYEDAGSPGVGRRIAARIDEIVARLELWPESGRLVQAEQGLRVVPLISFPYLVFYEPTGGGGIRILLVRHASRRPWSGG
jgi:plasmid stabilization system protein ParE